MQREYPVVSTAGQEVQSQHLQVRFQEGRFHASVNPPQVSLSKAPHFSALHSDLPVRGTSEEGMSPLADKLSQVSSLVLCQLDLTAKGLSIRNKQ